MYCQVQLSTTRTHIVLPDPGFLLLQASALYCQVQLCSTSFHFARRSVMIVGRLKKIHRCIYARSAKDSGATGLYDLMQHEAPLCTTSSHFVLAGPTLYCKLPLFTARSNFVLQAPALYWQVQLSTTSSHFALPGATFYCKPPLCTTRRDFAAQAFNLQSDL